MKRYKITVKGETPLLINTRQRDIDLELKEVKRDKLDEWEEKNWRRKAETDKKGKVCIPTRWMRAAFIEACKGTGVVPHFAKSKKQTYTKYAQSMIFENTSFSMDPKSLLPYGAFVGAQGANSKTKVWKIRPMVEDWETDFDMVDPFGRMNEKELKEILDYMGMLVGIGDGRSLNFGRFEIKSIKEK